MKTYSAANLPKLFVLVQIMGLLSLMVTVIQLPINN